MKHKHAEIIKAWADGAKIQVKAFNLTWDDRENPFWCLNREYRIKPEPKPDDVRYIVIEATSFDSHKFVQVYQTGKHLSPNLRLTFDGETGELKSAEVLK